MAIRYNLVGNDDQKNITVVVDGEMYVANSDNPNWKTIVQKVLSDDEDGLTDLFSPARTVEKNFKAVTERVSVLGSTILFDGDAVDNALTKQIIRFLDEGVDDWEPLVAFMEKVQQNPEQHSREQLYEWLSRHDFAIDDDGDIVAYKSVYRTDDGGYKSSRGGTAWVNGVEHKGQIPQKVGDVVTMPRSAVAFDPAQGCSAGLHVASHNYANSFLSGHALLHVKVNPRDVVSVPTDCDFEKVRVCRYEIIGEGDKVASASYSAYSNVDDDDDEYDDDEYDEDYDEPEDNSYFSRWF